MTIPANTPVVCENGHYVCMVKEELPLGSRVNTWTTNFIKWAQDEPSSGTLLPIRCARCSASVIGVSPGEWIRTYLGWVAP